MRIKLTVSALLLLSAFATSQTPKSSDTWEPLRYLIGSWEGTGSGQPGVSKVEREYRSVLADKYIEVQNKSRYNPQPKNPKREVHQDGGMISFDKGRKNFVLRQFHVEGFVNQYGVTSVGSGR